MTKNNQELIKLMEGLGFHQTKGKHGRNPTGNWSGKQNQLGRATTIIKEDTQKILNEVKKSELRGKILVLREELIGFSDTPTGQLLNDCIREVIGECEAKLQALEQGENE